jgi:hypothetical protein
LIVIDGILRFVELLRPGRRRPAVEAAQALGCPGCHKRPQVITLAEDAISLMCTNRDCPKPVMLTEHFPTEGEAVDAWNEMVAPPAAKQRDTIRASGSRSHFKKQ